MRFAVAVITRRRPDGLARLLASIDRLETIGPRGAIDLSIIVIENDDTASAMPACRWPSRHVLEPRQGIPVARNRAIDEARAIDPAADWVAFVDDDETVDPSWLIALARAAAESHADILTGPARPVLPEPVPRWALQTHAYDQPSHPDGSILHEAYTNNVAVRASLLGTSSCRFDERLLMTGGSDTHLFRSLARKGHRIQWCAEAVTMEHYPHSRLTRRWAARRAYRVGATNAWIMLDLRERTRLGCLALAVRFMARGLVRCTTSLVHGMVDAAAMHLVLDGAKALGLALGATGLDRFEEYATHHGS